MEIHSVYAGSHRICRALSRPRGSSFLQNVAMPELVLLLLCSWVYLFVSWFGQYLQRTNAVSS